MLRVLIVGLGKSGQAHLGTILASPGFEVAGIVRASSHEHDDNFRHFTSLEVALTEIAADIAVIATPHYLHYNQARLCLSRGLHVFIDKPMTLHYVEAEDLVRIAEAKHLLLVEGLQRRYEAFSEAFRLVSPGGIGDVRLVHGLFGHRFESQNQPTWRSVPEKGGQGIVDDSAIHLVDLLVFLSGGSPRHINTSVQIDVQTKLPISYGFDWDNSCGCHVIGCGTYLSPTNSVQEEISVFGSEGSLFARRFCEDWNSLPPHVFWKSSNGMQKRTFDASVMPMGRELPLERMLKVLTSELSRTTLFSEACHTLETHKIIEAMRAKCSPFVDDNT